MNCLKDRVAMITGGTGALGRAVNEHFLAHGAKVAVPYIIDAEVPLFHEKMGGRFSAANIHLEKIDVGNEDQVAAFVKGVEKKFGRVDILINLVGGFWGFKTVAETTMAEWQAMFDINLKPTFLCCRAAVPVMQKTSTAGSCRSARAPASPAPANCRLRDHQGRDQNVHRLSRRRSPCR